MGKQNPPCLLEAAGSRLLEVNGIEREEGEHRYYFGSGGHLKGGNI